MYGRDQRTLDSPRFRTRPCALAGAILLATKGLDSGPRGWTAQPWKVSCVCMCFGSPALKPCKVLSSPIASLSLPPCFSRGRQRLCDWQYRSHFLHLPDPISWNVKGTNKIYIQESPGSRATCHTKKILHYVEKGAPWVRAITSPFRKAATAVDLDSVKRTTADDRHLGNLNAWTTSQVPPLATPIPALQKSSGSVPRWDEFAVRYYAVVVVDRRTGTPHMHIASKGCRPPYHRMCMSPSIS